MKRQLPEDSAMRLADYSIRLDVPEDTPEQELEQMCRSLSLLDLRTVLEKLLATYTRSNTALRGVRVIVDE
jgi:hypothetical protein